VIVMTSYVALLAAVSLAAGSSPATTKKKAPAPAAAQPPAASEPRQTPTRATTSDSSEAKDVRVIPIDEKRAGKVYRVRTAAGYPAVLEFPEAFAQAPACGDCGERGLFRLDVFNDAHYVTIKPRVFPGPQPDGSFIAQDEFVTTLNVRLASQLTLTLQIELAEREKADARVVFTLPQRGSESAYVRDEITKARKALDDEFATRLDQGVVQAFLRALSQPHNCTSTALRTRHEDLVVEINELCYFGSAVYFRFTIENRGRAPADLADVALRKGTRGAASPLADARAYLPQTRLEFQGTVTGVVGAQLPDGEEPARAYELVITERGGKNRQLVASGFGF
jgi:hypothetical protein